MVALRKSLSFFSSLSLEKEKAKSQVTMEEDEGSVKKIKISQKN